MHEIRSMENHLKNTWQWDKWGFTESWNKCTMSDVDGFAPYLAERKGYFLLVEMKHWDGTGSIPMIDFKNGQIRALDALSKQPNFMVVFGFGDTSTQTIHYYEIWDASGHYKTDVPFKQMLDTWYKTVSSYKG